MKQFIEFVPLILFFVVYHILHLTVGVLDSAQFQKLDDQDRVDVYSIMGQTFGSLWQVLIYVIAMLFLGFHLAHGARSLFQTIGVNHESHNKLLDGLTWLLILALVVGFCSIPVVLYWRAQLLTTGGPG